MECSHIFFYFPSWGELSTEGNVASANFMTSPLQRISIFELPAPGSMFTQANDNKEAKNSTCDVLMSRLLLFTSNSTVRSRSLYRLAD
ncbi:hypothetical protein ACTXT7_007518 [Hymenolepis weldensis]